MYFYSKKEKFKNNDFNYAVKGRRNVCQKVKRLIFQNRESIMKANCFFKLN